MSAPSSNCLEISECTAPANGVVESPGALSSSAADVSGGGNTRQSPSSVSEEITEEITEACCCPSSCLVREPIDPDNVDDSVVRVVCTNPRCKVRPFMHKACFDAWETDILAYVRTTGRARNWSDKQMQQNLWTKKGFDLAFKACDCLCGHGRVRKDLTPFSCKNVNVDDKKRRRKKSGPLFLGTNGGCGGKFAGLTSPTTPFNDQSTTTGTLGPRMRSRTLSLGSAAGLFAGGGGHVPLALAAGRHGAKKTSVGGASAAESTFFTDQQVQCTGSIFHHRDSLSGLFAHLPSWKRNGIHVKMEDDCPQGNDETRIFLLTNLGHRKIREMTCVLCSAFLSIYDRYPLIDGTLFISPLNHANIGVKIKHDGREGFVHALCVSCLEQPRHLRCRRCSSRDWFVGDRLIVGTLYAYDVLASRACGCAPSCRSCRAALTTGGGGGGARPFSAPSEMSACPHCGHADFHFARRLDSVERMRAARA